jgi:hypothetical protein
MDRGHVLPVPRVVHIAGSATADIFRFLGPTTYALAGAGREQTVVMIDEAREWARPGALHETVEVLVAPRAANPLSQWAALLRRSREAMLARPLQAVHLHGLLPGMIGAWVARSVHAPVPIYYSPYSASHPLRSLALLAIRSVLRTRRGATIVSLLDDAKAFERWHAAEPVEIPVADAFFDAARTEAAHPVIVAGGGAMAARSVDLFAQLAVLLGDEELHTSFVWIGPLGATVRTPLDAAGVEVSELANDAERSSRLSAAWIYVAVADAGGGDTMSLIEAMSAGLPCVAIDCAQHRALIRDGENGYLCASERDAIERLAMLIDDPALRERLGTAARQEARRRFGASAFASKLLSAYALAP